MCLDPYSIKSKDINVFVIVSPVETVDKIQCKYYQICVTNNLIFIEINLSAAICKMFWHNLYF